MNICNLTIEEYEKKIVEFHGTLAPGLLIGGFMVDAIRKKLPDTQGRFYDVICESMKCLPDAIQLLTPCSIGNGWLKILKIGRFAMTFFDKETGAGIRGYLDTEKLKKYPSVNEWFFKLIPKKEQDGEKLMNSIRQAGSDIISLRHVHVDTSYTKKKKHGRIAICEQCNESYPLKEDVRLCKVCSGEIHYFTP